MRRLLLQAGLAVALLAGVIGIASADVPEGPSEAKVKATFLFKFTSYVDWPSIAFEQADAPLVICVVDADEVASELLRLTAGRSVSGHAIQVKRVSGGDAIVRSHVLFVGTAASSRLGRILSATRNQPVLTVTELDDALAFGSVINFVLIDDQVRFDVSLPAAERGALKISSRLLSVARQVVTVTP
ncbi:YfiR family protein [Uliginosibacterium sp. H3]|uniref:YfiR family protein n=1 Tax=Uliginosibacterium silvisoli TaxID=3114758 RepID=A0ABU6K446_9RHOO|nr:YfiR family protein [Uliginosibacterium sp. H3]